MMIAAPVGVDTITSLAIGGNRLAVGTGVMGSAGAFAGGQTRTPVMLPFTSIYLNMRSEVGSCVVAPSTTKPKVGAIVRGSIPSKGNGVRGCGFPPHAPTHPFGDRRRSISHGVPENWNGNWLMPRLMSSKAP